MKRYLTGIDWVINSTDYLGKAQSGIGNISQIVLELSGQPDRGILRELLQNFIQKFPLINGLPSRGFNLCPYWKACPQDKTLLLRVIFTHLKKDVNPFLPLEAQVNEPFVNEREHLVFNLVYAGKRSLLGMTFDHRVLDARGAEAFLDLFQCYYQKEVLPLVTFSEPAHLDRWKEKFMAGSQANRAFLNLSKSKPKILPIPPRGRVFNFKVIHFDPVEAGRFIGAAYAQAGYLMLMPYALAESVRIMHRIFEARNIPGLTYTIPVTIDARPEKIVRRRLFFNHASFFLFKIKADTVTRFPHILAQIKEQMYEQVKAGLPEAIKNASFLLRIAPLPLTMFFLKWMSKDHFGSFSFSFVSSAYNAKKFMNEDVQNITHLPRVPSPPGIGIFFNQFNDKLNVTISYLDGLLSENEVNQIVSDFKTIGNAN